VEPDIKDALGQESSEERNQEFHFSSYVEPGEENNAYKEVIARL